MTEPVQSVSFLAAFPPIQSAIKMHGEGGCRIQLDIPENEMGAFIRAISWTGKILRVTIEVDKSNDGTPSDTVRHRKF